MPVSPGIRWTGPAAAVAAALLVPLTACDDDAATAPLAPEDALEKRVELGGLSAEEALGRAIFFDRSLSLRQNQACAACHAPAFGFSGPIPALNRRGAVYPGSIAQRAGNRRPPSAAYATLSPPLFWDADDEVWVGGTFWDGRATGWALGNPAADQALGPFLNPVEQALPDPICVLHGIASSPYVDLWEEVWGEDLRDLAFPSTLRRACKSEDPIDYPDALRAVVLANYDRVGLAVAAYEASDEVNPFSSKFDAVMAGRAEFTPLEAFGSELFDGKAQCAACHPSEGVDGEPPLFTDFTYDNLGLPANPMNPVYESHPGFVDLGLGGFLETPTGQVLAGGAGVDPADFYGAVKVPTLRNTDRAPGRSEKAFGHNGVFKSLEQIVHFYNTRDVLRECAPGEIAPTPRAIARMGFDPACWNPAEVPTNVNVEELGDLGLTPFEERALVAFLRTLNDGWRR